jgi:hypothetical protein
MARARPLLEALSLFSPAALRRAELSNARDAAAGGFAVSIEIETEGARRSSATG